MDNKLQIFNNPEFGEIRVIGDFDNPLFCLADVCKALDLQVAAVLRRLDKGVISSHPLDTAGGKQLMYFVNEDGLYDVILESRKPEAKKFRKWLTHEVIPSIRKTGSYSINNEPGAPLPHEIDNAEQIWARINLNRGIELRKMANSVTNPDAKQALLIEAANLIAGREILSNRTFSKPDKIVFMD